MIKSLKFAIAGIRYVWREERNFRIICSVAVLAILVGWYISFTPYEWVVLLGCIVAVLVAEMVNTAIEDLCDKIEPQTDPIIGKIKDIMAGVVLVTFLGALVVVVLLMARRFPFFL